MKIRKVNIKCFGTLKDVNAEFKDGLNIVYGQNESGKSTLQEFLKIMLYGYNKKSKAKKGVPPVFKKYRPWSGEMYSGAMEYVLDNGEFYRIERNFEKHTVKILDGHFNDITSDFEISKDKGPVYAEKQLGISEEHFEKTSFVKQLQCRIGDAGAEGLSEKIQNVTQTGAEDVSVKKAQDLLKDAIRDRIGNEKTTSKPLDKVYIRLKELEGILEKAKQDKNILLEMQLRLSEINTRLKEHENNLNLLRQIKPVLDKGLILEEKKVLVNEVKEYYSSLEKLDSQLEELLSEYKQLSEQARELDAFSSLDSLYVENLIKVYENTKLLRIRRDETVLKISKAEAEMLEIDIKLKEYNSFNSLPEGYATQVMEKEKMLEALKSNLDNSDSGSENVEGIQKELNAYDSKSKLYGAAALALALAGGLLSFTGHLPLGIGILFLAALSGGLFGYSLSKKNALKSEYSYKKAKNEEEKRKYHQQAQKIQLLEDELNEIYKKHSVENSAGLLQMEKDYLILISGKKSCENMLNAYNSELQAIGERFSASMRLLKNAIEAAGLKIPENRLPQTQDIENIARNVEKVNQIHKQTEVVQEKIKTLKENREEILKKASKRLGEQILTVEQYGRIIYDLEKQLENIYNDALTSFKNIAGESEFLEPLYSAFAEKEFENTVKLYEVRYNTHLEELSKIKIEQKETETKLLSYDGLENSMLKAEMERETLINKKQKLLKAKNALEIAFNIITEASEEVRMEFTPKLNDRLGKLMGQISGNRYTQIKTDHNLGINLLSRDANSVISTVDLSGGTVDQVYLALRLAMTDILSSKGERLPIILDEIFSQYDDKRTAASIELLSNIAENKQECPVETAGYQIILFTCKNNEVEMARKIAGSNVNVISLSI